MLYDEEERIFKMWYVPWAWEDRRRPWCYATSTDGFHWEKPDLGVVEYSGSKLNNMVGFTVSRAITTSSKTFATPTRSGATKPRGRCTAPAATSRPAAWSTAYSPDGIHWTCNNQAVVVYGPDVADASTVLGWDPRRQKYIGYFRPGHPLAHEIDGIGRHRHIRTVGYAESDDFEHWTPTRIMLAPDDKDRVDHQYQYFTAALYGEFYVAFLMVHKTHDQVWDTFLMSSRDGFHWTWVDRHEPSSDAGRWAPTTRDT